MNVDSGFLGAQTAILSLLASQQGGGHDVMQIIRFSCDMISTNPIINITMFNVRYHTPYDTSCDGIDITYGDLLQIVFDDMCCFSIHVLLSIPYVTSVRYRDARSRCALAQRSRSARQARALCVASWVGVHTVYKGSCVVPQAGTDKYHQVVAAMRRGGRLPSMSRLLRCH